MSNYIKNFKDFNALKAHIFRVGIRPCPADYRPNQWQQTE